ncbi:MAG TPA: YbjQ family protein [Bacteroidales bacterium]|mgnify:CR=1 FL=1|nr:YbjQ family protein [Bacteroidales bacterium]
MIYVNTDFIQGKTISETLGLVRGSTVRARNIGNDILASLKNIVGGEISDYTKLLAEAREEAISRMLDDAKRLNADAIINVRFMTSTVGQGMAEIMAYGTAVKFV